MPLYQNFSDNKAVVWIWKYDESEELNPQELLEPENFEKVTHYHPKKLSEVLMVRKMLKNFYPSIKYCIKKTENLIWSPQIKKYQ